MKRQLFATGIVNDRVTINKRKKIIAKMQVANNAIINLHKELQAFETDSCQSITTDDLKRKKRRLQQYLSRWRTMALNDSIAAKIKDAENELQKIENQLNNVV